MEIIAINLNEGNNKEIYWGRSKKFKKEWKALVSDPTNHYDPVTFYKEHGREWNGYEIMTDGEPKTIQEKLIQRLYQIEPTYERMSTDFPEDFIESRTSWDDLKDYADDMKWFIWNLLDMI